MNLIRPTGRAALCVGAALAVSVVLAAAPASAASVDGIDLTPVPALVDGEPVTNFQVDLPERGVERVQYAVTNTGTSARTVRVYGVGATRRESGSFSLTDDESPYVRLPAESIELGPGQSQVKDFAVELTGGDLPAEEQYAAVVLEVENGSVVQRVATVVYLRPEPALPVPVLLVIGAGVLVVVVGAAVLVARRRST